MSYEEDSANCWTIVKRHRRRVLPKKRDPKLLNRDSLRSQSYVHDNDELDDNNVSRLQKDKLPIENSDLPILVRNLVAEVSRLKAQVESSRWWYNLAFLLSSQGLVSRKDSFPAVTSSNFMMEQEINSWKPVGKLVCYGLGSFENSVISRYQLALAKLLQGFCVANRKDDQSDVRHSQSLIYDPVMSAVDIELCSKLGFVRLEPSLQHSSKSIVRESSKFCSFDAEDDSHSMFFMPHCGRSLYNTVLKENWNRRRLNKVIILGNSFSFYQTFGHTVDADSYLGLASLWMKELKCPGAQFSPLYEAFNDLSVHMFPIESLPHESEQVWSRSHFEIAAD